jgi:hypothetical protein
VTVAESPQIKIRCGADNENVFNFEVLSKLVHTTPNHPHRDDARGGSKALLRSRDKQQDMRRRGCVGAHAPVRSVV